MDTSFVDFVAPRLLTVFVSALPVVELRGALPMAYTVLHLSLQEAFFWSVLGSSIAGILILVLLKPIETLCSKHLPRCNIFVQRYLNHVRQKFTGTHAKYGAFGIAVLSAIPIPVLGGAWTGALAAHVLGLPKRLSIPSVVAGVVLMGVIVALTTAGIIKFL